MAGFSEILFTSPNGKALSHESASLKEKMSDDVPDEEARGIRHPRGAQQMVGVDEPKCRAGGDVADDSNGDVPGPDIFAKAQQTCCASADRNSWYRRRRLITTWADACNLGAIHLI